MSEPGDNLSQPSFWKDITQNKSQRVFSQRAIRRNWRNRLKLVAGIMVLGLVAVLYFSKERLAETHPLQMGPELHENYKFSQVKLLTNGVLDDAWLGSQFSWQAGMSLLDLDIYEIKQQLESVEQIIHAEVRIRLPGTLLIQLEEQKPALRIRLQLPDGSLADKLVADNGTVFEGVGYPQSTLRRLPYLSGVPVQQRKGSEGILPLDKVAEVAPLLRTAREEFPQLYADWRLVSLENWKGAQDPSSLIEVKSRFEGQILFSADAFSDQLRRLQRMRDHAMAQNISRLQKVDLSYAGRVIAQ